ncbi:MAG: sigma factor, partial [Pseudomonadota bacterium]
MTAGATPSLHAAVERSYADLLRLIYARTGSRQLAEDAVLETWIRAAKAPVDTPRNPTAYVRRMAINIAIDLMRAS